MLIRHWLSFSLVFPCTASAWLPGPSQPDAVAGFSVDRNRRNDVLGFHRSVDAASEGNEQRMAWTGSYAACLEGTTASVYQDDVRRKINYFRALAGVPANIALNSGALVLNDGGGTPPPGTTKQAACQRAALMFSVAGTVVHDPPNAPPFSCWTVAALNAAHHSNLALGFHGVAAIDAYMRENDPVSLSLWTINGGHRRWLILPGSTDMATGDVPAEGGHRATNVLYVMPRTDEIVAQPPAFVGWPSAGYFPDTLMTAVWSLSYPGANFSAATVQMSGPDGPVPVTVVDRTSSGLGDPAILWAVPASVAANSVETDTEYQVTVSGITGGAVPSSHSYSVRVFDPDRVNETLLLAGPSVVTAAGADYSFAPVDAAVSHTGEVREVVADPWTEGGEDAGLLIDGTSAGYSLLSSVSWNGSQYWRTGGKALHLAFDRFVNPPTEDFFELGRDLLPGAGGQLWFSYRRGFMASGTSLVVESSIDGGLSWQPLGSPVTGTGKGATDSSFTDVAVALPSGVGPVRVRFAHRWSNGTPFYSVQSNPTLPAGIFIDDIRTTGVSWLWERGVVALDNSGNWHFDQASSGLSFGPGTTFALRMRPEFGGRPMAWGPTTMVGIPAMDAITGNPNPPVSGADYLFAPQAGATGYQVQVLRASSSTWREGAEASPVPQVIDGTAATYSLLTTKQKKNGKRSFRLACPLVGGVPSVNPEWFEIARRVLPSSSSVLTFCHRSLDLMNTQFLHAEVSADGGATWTSLWNTAGGRYFSGTRLKGKRDGGWTIDKIALGGFAGTEIRLRFILRTSAGGMVVAPTESNQAGVWIDDISVSSAEEVSQSMETNLPSAATVFTLDAVSAGGPLIPGANYRLRMRALYADGPGPWGPTLTVVPRP